jgi:hypothetical protein
MIAEARMLLAEYLLNLIVTIAPKNDQGLRLIQYIYWYAKERKENFEKESK